jgi:uncharacterized membrane protein
MFMGELMLPAFLADSLANLNYLGFSFGDWLQGSEGTLITFLWLLIAFIIISFSNSNELAKKLKPNKRNLVLNILLLIISLSILNNASEFLYFNF